MDSNFTPKLSDYGFNKELIVQGASVPESLVRYIVKIIFIFFFKILLLFFFFTKAPEVIFTNDHTFKSDVWSFGVILFELITKEVPYRQHNVKQIENFVKNKMVKLELDETQQEEWKPLSEIFNLCIKFIPEERKNFLAIQREQFKNI